ncbi:MAG: glycosyltransferase family 2 protein [Gemmiger sp.]|uniref:glycosyltransferase family 2 protein n=1 Tax=Gemmiger sp. TaxID=2049027 RepID=UPI002E799D14|nr:glycosyltransferase family 2 protein [Gemmiger sp.]MEE0800090.1 glycosyltransferase family 2 protein [Gemmiger sp.]
MSERKKKISVMIPTYNEEANVCAIYTAVREELLRSCPAYDYEILFIDNKSRDRTRELIRQICAADSHVRAIFNCKNFGQFNSPYYGMIHTSGDCCITLCADFQDPVEMIPRFIAEWEKGYKIVIGRKTRSRENPIVYSLRGLYYKILRKMSTVEFIEQFTGFGLYDQSFLQTLRDLHDPTPFIRGIVAELGPERSEIEYEQPRRRAGKTHNNWYSLFDAAMLSFTSYTKVGMRMAEFFGFLVAALSFLFGLFFLVAKLVAWNSFSAGYAPTMIAVFFMGGVQLVFLGFLGEYVMAMNTRIMNRPLVVEEERLNFPESAAPSEESETETVTL